MQGNSPYMLCYPGRPIEYGPTARISVGANVHSTHPAILDSFDDAEISERPADSTTAHLTAVVESNGRSGACWSATNPLALFWPTRTAHANRVSRTRVHSRPTESDSLMAVTAGSKLRHVPIGLFRCRRNRWPIDRAP